MHEKAKFCLFYLYATAKNEIQICSNKREIGLVCLLVVNTWKQASR